MEVEDELAKRKNEIGQLETKVAELVNLFFLVIKKVVADQRLFVYRFKNEAILFF